MHVQQTHPRHNYKVLGRGWREVARGLSPSWSTTNLHLLIQGSPTSLSFSQSYELQPTHGLFPATERTENTFQLCLSITISPLTQKVLGGSTDDLSTSSLHLCRSSIDSSAVSVFLRSTISTKFVTLDGYETWEGGRGMKWSQLGAPRPNSYTQQLHAPFRHRAAQVDSSSGWLLHDRPTSCIYLQAGNGIDTYIQHYARAAGHKPVSTSWILMSKCTLLLWTGNDLNIYACAGRTFPRILHDFDE